MSAELERLPLALRRPLRWRDAEGGLVELHDPARGTWARLQPWTRDVLVALEGGEGLDALSRLAQGGDADPQREAALRRFLQSLSKVGYLDILVAAPALLHGRYEVERELGRGGVGVAYLCRDAATGDDVVVKRAWGFLHALPVAEAALRREAEHLRALDHPNIVAWRDAFEQDGRFHLARAFAPGASLTERYDAKPEADRAAALRIAEGLGAALAHIHSRGLLLIDHKPGNVHVEGARVALVDVGNAERGERVELRALRGTRGFTPPEMALARRADRRSDVWGLGRMVAFVRTGRMFRRDPPLADVLDGLAPPERDALARLCADEPTARPASIDEALAILRGALT